MSSSSYTSSKVPSCSFNHEQEHYETPTYVQIPIEQFTRLIGVEEQVRSFEEQVQAMGEHIKELDEQLTSAHAEITAKDDLAKQHAKVAEEAVSGILLM